MNQNETDVSKFIEAKSDQLNAADLAGRSICVKITEVQISGGREQPVTLHIGGGHKPWKPCKTTMRIMAGLWSADASKWVGKSVRLFCDPEVTWAGVKVGGIRISGMSDIPKPQMVGYRVSKKVVAEQRIDVLEPVNAGPRPALMACVKSFNATQLDLVEFMSEKTGSDPGPIDAWPDKQVATVLSRLQGGGADTFRSWLAARVNASSVPDWQDDENRNPESDDLPE